jgi:hypothetical protein
MSPADMSARAKQRAFWTTIVFVSIVMCVVTFDTLFVVENRDSIRKQEESSDQRSRRRDAQQVATLATEAELGYKLCVRVNDTRGVVIITTAAARVSKRPLRNDLPLYQCKPGDSKTVILTPAQQTAYLNLLRRGKAPGP